MVALQSEEIEQARQGALVGRYASLTPEQRAEVKRVLAAEKQKQRAIWKGGKEPMPFDAFCIALDKKGMFPRQRKAWEETNCLRAADLLSPSRKVTEWVLIWGKRCLAGETPLRDESSGVTRTIAEWAESGQTLTLLTTDGVRVSCGQATAPFKKGSAPLFRVTLEDGTSFRATEEHLCLTPGDWIRVGDMVPGITAIDTLPRRDDDPQDSNHTLVVSVVPDGEGDFYDLTMPGTECYYDANGVLHHNSGKDMMVSKLFAYLIYILHHLKDKPAVYYDTHTLQGRHVSEGSTLDIINIAPTGPLATRVFFGYVKNWLRTPMMRRFRVEPRSDQWKSGTDHIHFPDINVSMHSKTSNIAGADGFNVLAFCMDEADAFQDSGGKSNASAIYEMLSASAFLTVGNFMLALIISYPRTEQGWLLRHYREVSNSVNTYRDLAATNEVREGFSFDEPQIADAFKRDPAQANAMFRCIPMAVGDAFIENAEKIDEAIDATRKPIAEVVKENIERNGIGYVTAKISHIKKTPGHTYFLSVDAGTSEDSFAIGVMHIDGTSNAPKWWCPSCGARPESQARGTYEKLMQSKDPNIPTSPWLYAQEDARCTGCGGSPMELTPMTGKRGWWRLVEESVSPRNLVVDGSSFTIPHIYEDLLIDVQPHKSQGPDDKGLTVDLVGMEKLLRELIVTLKPKVAGFDPWQMKFMGQLLAGAGSRIVEVSFSQPEQFCRAMLFKTLLYTNFLTLLPGEPEDMSEDKARRELRQLQRKGLRIDHPPKSEGGSKDLYDVRAMGVFAAATSVNAKIREIFLPNAQMGSSDMHSG